jgi:hypothetical protein
MQSPCHRWRCVQLIVYEIIFAQLAGICPVSAGDRPDIRTARTARLLRGL